MKKTISIYNRKGGVGKTSLSFSLAKDLNFKYVTNDMSASLLKSKGSLKKGKIVMTENTLYDFGGFQDKEALSTSVNSQILIIPTICDMNSLAKTLSLLKEIGESKNACVVGTMIETQKDIKDISLVIGKHFPKVPIFFIQKTKLLKNAMELGIGASELASRDKIYKRAFSSYNKLLNFCKERAND